MAVLYQCSVVSAGDGQKQEIVCWLPRKQAQAGNKLRHVDFAGTWYVWAVYAPQDTAYLKLAAALGPDVWR